MPPLSKRLLELVAKEPGLTDRELTDRLLGASAPQQRVNQVARQLAKRGKILRQKRSDGLIGNYAGSSDQLPREPAPIRTSKASDGLQEDEVKRYLKLWLESRGWQVEVKWRHEPGTDIVANQMGQTWLIEVKGSGSRQQMRVNYFLSILGAILQRMESRSARYSIALPDMKQFRGLWERLPKLAKSRTEITALFVAANGEVEEVEE